ncbi:TetR/AcrR family transcriptional regulator [Nocardiopsis sp. N85]|uniref:TetR/AcrR family transcriptional regulator n=1 Tax=Nocardiopsis sp. N85 TaxID=3029400 RepID=UPI00237F58A8|nr:TetR/AcrR family transcriptional regulator [Nocardiopsis sp. N85]MDE3722186.1 TetR/AcrR family transcriptional regulator [Nocardiopsis sp. N85]
MAGDTRERLVRVARDLIHGSSFAQVSVEDICKEAGVHRGSLYHFFPSKERLGLAVLDANWAMMAALLDEAFGAEAPPLERIDRFVRGFGGMIALMRERTGSTPECPIGGLSAELSAKGDEPRAHATRILDAWAAYFSDAIREAEARGEVDPTVDPHETALRILAYLQGTALLAKAYDRPEIVEHARDGVRALLAPSR